MRGYETMCIVHPEVVGDAYAAVLEKFKGILADQQATLLKIDEWGERKLAYPIQKQGRGVYVLFFFEASSAGLNEFERRLRLDESIMRFQTVRYEPGAEPEVEESQPVSEEADEEAAAEEATEQDA